MFKPSFTLRAGGNIWKPLSLLARKTLNLLAQNLFIFSRKPCTKSSHVINSPQKTINLVAHKSINKFQIQAKDSVHEIGEHN